MKYISLILIIFLLPITSLFAAPTLNGIIYGDGDIDEYYYLADASGVRGTLYYYLDSDWLYLAVVVSTSVNDNVFGKMKTDKAYVQSVGWSNKHQASVLIGSDHLELELISGTETWHWSQDLLHDVNDNSSPSENDWISTYAGPDGLGTPPPGLESSSSTAWNFNNTSWDVTLQGTRTLNTDWKSPYNAVTPETAPGYPTHDSFNAWEWPLVYEMRIPATSLSGNVSVEVVSAHNSPAKDSTEDIPIPPVKIMDLGDAADSYNTLTASLGAGHWILPNGIYLGSSVDAETDGQPSADSKGDDNDGNDDEDGVVFTDVWSQSGNASLVVTAFGSGFLSAWADFNGNGSFADPGEQIFTDQSLANGVNNLQVSVPADAVLGSIQTRFRYSSQTGLSYNGIAIDGEVEDHQVVVSEPLASLGDLVWQDLNPDGIQQGEEPGVSGISVNLRNSGGIVASTITDGSGNYLFSGLAAGDYWVEFIIPQPWSVSPQNAGNDQADSDADQITGLTGTYTLTAGETNLTVDCGVYSGDPLPVTLSIFSAAQFGAGAKLQWITESESNNAGWNIYRALSQNMGQAILINPTPVAGAGTTSQPTDYSYSDYGLEEYLEGQDLSSVTVHYWLESVAYDGSTELHGPVSFAYSNSQQQDDAPFIAEEYGFQQNYPNPFNPSTVLSYALKRDGEAGLVIYNTKGQQVAELFRDEFVEADKLNFITWKGRDDSGNRVASGIYLVVLKSDNEQYVQKIVLQK